MHNIHPRVSLLTSASQVISTPFFHTVKAWSKLGGCRAWESRGKRIAWVFLGESPPGENECIGESYRLLIWNK